MSAADLLKNSQIALRESAWDSSAYLEECGQNTKNMGPQPELELYRSSQAAPQRGVVRGADRGGAVEYIGCGGVRCGTWSDVVRGGERHGLEWCLGCGVIRCGTV